MPNGSRHGSTPILEKPTRAHGLYPPCSLTTFYKTSPKLKAPPDGHLTPCLQAPPGGSWCLSGGRRQCQSCCRNGALGSPLMETTGALGAGAGEMAKPGMRTAGGPQDGPTRAPRCGREKACPGDRLVGWLLPAATSRPPSLRPAIPHVPETAEPGTQTALASPPEDQQPPSPELGEGTLAHPRWLARHQPPIVGLAGAQSTFPESFLSAWLPIHLLQADPTVGGRAPRAGAPPSPRLMQSHRP